MVCHSITSCTVRNLLLCRQLFCITDDCEQLRNKIDAELYEACRTDKEMDGFDFVDAFYVTNIGRAPYSHNPEWIVSGAKKAIKNADAEDKPFFLYMALTLTHEPDVIDTLKHHTILESPKGDLKGDEIVNILFLPLLYITYSCISRTQIELIQ